MESEVYQAISENVPSRQSQKIVELYESGASQEDFYSLAKKFIGESEADHRWVATGVNNEGEKKKSYFDFLKSEVYLLFCSDDKKYSEYRGKIDGNVKVGVGIAITALATTLNISTGFISAAVTCIVLCVYKISKNAWCEYSKTYA